MNFLAGAFCFFHVGAQFFLLPSYEFFFLFHFEILAYLGADLECDVYSCSEYERLLGLTPYVLRKCRYAFVYAGHHMDLDVYDDKKNNPEQGGGTLAVLEVELGHIDESCVFPPAWRLEDVTNNHRFSNRVLSGCPGEMNFHSSRK